MRVLRTLRSWHGSFLEIVLDNWRATCDSKFMENETISVRLSQKNGVPCEGAREIAMVRVPVFSDSRGAYCHLGGLEVPYRPKLSAGGAAGTVYLSAMYARGMGLL